MPVCTEALPKRVFQEEKVSLMETTQCVRCGCTIPNYNVTGACKSCFDFYRKKDKNGFWYVETEKKVVK